MEYIAFDPKPFIRSFEAAVDKLITVRKDVQTRTEQLEKSVRVGEREYSKKMVELTKSFDVSSLSCLMICNIEAFLQAVGNTFSGMEEKINLVSSTAIRIGQSPFDRLSKILTKPKVTNSKQSISNDRELRPHMI